MKIMLITGGLMLAAGLAHSLTTGPGHSVNGWTIVLVATVGAFARSWWIAEKDLAAAILEETGR